MNESNSTPIMRVLGYVRCSTIEQADSRLGIEAQRACIAAEADRRGWSVDYIEDAGYSAKDLRRPGIAAALGLLATGQADVLMVSRLDRLSRSVHDFAGLTEQASRQGWSVACLDLGVDTTTPEGEMMANVRASFAAYERRLIGQRTREALAIRKAAGVKLGGSERIVRPELETRARALRAEGFSFRRICDALTVEAPEGPTGRGWNAMTVRAMVTRA